MNSSKRTHGVSGKPILCDRILTKEQDATKFGSRTVSVLAVNSKAKTITSVNIYGVGDSPFTGAGYDANQMTQPLPEKGSDKWKKWNKSYEEQEALDLTGFEPVLQAVETEATEDEKVEEEVEQDA